MGYVALIRERRYADAYRTIKEDNPFPSVCGRVCNHRCEEACTRGENGGHEAVNIMHLKRFVTDWAFAHPEEVQKAYAAGVQVKPDTSGLGKKVAIIGSGPAGMTAAGDLINKNYEVTVFEALPAAGGMMRVGIPEYRMPYDLVQREIDEIVARGVQLKLNTRVDDVNALLGESRAIGTEIPGRTRYTIEESLQIKGIPVYLTDTAGIRATQDRIEQLGIEKSKEAFNKADLILFVVDASQPLEEEDLAIARHVVDRQAVVLLNKEDLGRRLVREELVTRDLLR